MSVACSDCPAGPYEVSSRPQRTVFSSSTRSAIRCTPNGPSRAVAPPEWPVTARRSRASRQRSRGLKSPNSGISRPSGRLGPDIAERGRDHRLRSVVRQPASASDLARCVSFSDRQRTRSPDITRHGVTRMPPNSRRDSALESRGIAARNAIAVGGCTRRPCDPPSCYPGRSASVLAVESDGLNRPIQPPAMRVSSSAAIS
jgi:hypothetical protein